MACDLFTAPHWDLDCLLFYGRGDVLLRSVLELLFNWILIHILWLVADNFMASSLSARYIAFPPQASAPVLLKQLTS
jgi:hypothetical protein